MKYKLKLLILFFLILSITAINCEAKLLNDYKSNVILQGFHWNSHVTQNWWTIVKSKASEISNAGFSIVWLPPASQSASAEGYLPNKLYNINSKYGSSDNLKMAINQLHKYKIKVLADIVINHRVGVKDWADFEDPKWGPDSVCCDDEWPWAKGNKDTGIRYRSARDIDHTKPYVQKSIIKWMKWLRSEYKYDGWRYDFVKGYSGKFVEKYNKSTQPFFSVGEFWDNLDLNNPNPHRQRLCDWVDSTHGNSSVFDFSTKGILQKAFIKNQFWRLKDKDGKPSGLIGWWPQAAVTFLDNHDTGPSPGKGNGQNHWPFPSSKVMAGYAYILTHPGIPCVYWPHFFDWNKKEEITKLIKIRKKKGITSCSKVKIIAADNEKYVAIIDNVVTVKIGKARWSPNNKEWKLETSGNCYAVWSKK